MNNEESKNQEVNEENKVVIKDKPTPQETETLNEEELVDLVDDETKKLYDEFSIFVEQKTDVKRERLETKSTISTGIKLLDTILGGGIAIGAINIFVGNPGCGKSTLAGQIIAQMQKQYKQNIAVYLDSEESTTTNRLKLLGVNKPPITPYGDITLEKVFNIINSICLFKEQKNLIDIPALVVWDSVANTLSEKEIEIDDVNKLIGYKARLLSLLIPKAVKKCSTYNISLLCINQLRDNVADGMGAYSAPKDLKFLSYNKTMPGGNTLKFNAFQLLELKLANVFTDDKYGFNASMVRIKSVKNKLFPCNIEVELLGDFVKGFNNFWTSYNFLVSNKLIQSGAWNYLTTYPNKKFRTKEAVSLYQSDSKFREEFDKLLEKGLEENIINIYKNI